MSNKQEIASSLNEIWGKLSTRWTGENSNAFHQQLRRGTQGSGGDYEEATRITRRGCSFPK